MRYLVCYDIENDKKRTRLVKILEKYGERVQFSVFEIQLPPSLLKTLRKKLAAEKILEKTDSLLIYPLCDTCYPKVERTGKNRLLDPTGIVF
jgi:CRISPR-associated protein Cas2